MKNEKSLELYLNEIKKAKLRLTNQRIEIVKCLMKHDNWHTIDDIVEHLSIEKRKKPNIASIYNVLHSLIQCGIVNAFLNTRTFKPFFNLRHKNHEHVYCFSFKNSKFITLSFNEKLHKNIKDFFKENNIFVNDFYIVATGMVKEDGKKCEK